MKLGQLASPASTHGAQIEAQHRISMLAAADFLTQAVNMRESGRDVKIN